VVQIAGVLVTIRASRALDVLELAGIRQVRPDAADEATPPRLTTGGLYGFVRHPIYFGWALMVFGAPTMTGSRLAFACISTAYLALAIPWEERALVAAFGAEYRHYRQRVRWRMLPYVY
jgi:protein-S-isoprenylcysteine O-methyltransferase Ste14